MNGANNLRPSPYLNAYADPYPNAYPDTWRIRFDSVDEPRLGAKWRRLFDEHQAAYQRWYLSEGISKRPAYRQCRDTISEFMPELLNTYDDICALAGGSDWVSRFLSLYCPPRYITGCSQIVWPGKAHYSLIRNYDYHPQLLDGVVLKSCWNGKSVIAMTDCLWGATDGMNEDGLAISLTFGGSTNVGEGFGIPLIIRYILEFCSTVSDAAAVFTRVPSHMAYNVTMLDKSGQFSTAFISPDKPPAIRPVPVATNHQGMNRYEPRHLETQTVAREKLLNRCLADGNMDEGQLLNLFMSPPLYTRRYQKSFGTVFTSHYRPATGEIYYYWPQYTWDCSFARFAESSRLLNFSPWGTVVEQGFLPPVK